MWCLVDMVSCRCGTYLVSVVPGGCGTSCAYPTLSSVLCVVY